MPVSAFDSRADVKPNLDATDERGVPADLREFILRTRGFILPMRGFILSMRGFILCIALLGRARIVCR